MAIEIKDLKLAVGKCETCKHVSISQYDPSPVGISLSSGTMTEMECTRETETIPDTVDIDGAGIDYQCPDGSRISSFARPTVGFSTNQGIASRVKTRCTTGCALREVLATTTKENCHEKTNCDDPTRHRGDSVQVHAGRQSGEDSLH